MFLSFVIPLYNCEQYVGRSLDSILTCPLAAADYEVVIVNDGSTDCGPETCQQYVADYSQIRLINQENLGSSAARNRGLEEAQGDYIWFVDADDRIDPAVLTAIRNDYGAGTAGADLYCFNHTTENVDGLTYVDEFKESCLMDGCSYIMRHPYLYLWNKVFRRTSIGSIRFPDGTRNTEDWYFDLATIIDMPRVVCIAQNGYIYNTTNMMSTLRIRTRESKLSNSYDSQLMHRKIWEIAEATSDTRKRQALLTALHYSIAGHLYALFVDRVSIGHIRQTIDSYKELGLYPVPRTYSRRANQFLMVANRPWLYYLAAWGYGRYVRISDHVNKLG